MILCKGAKSLYLKLKLRSIYTTHTYLSKGCLTKTNFKRPWFFAKFSTLNPDCFFWNTEWFKVILFLCDMETDLLVKSQVLFCYGMIMHGSLLNLSSQFVLKLRGQIRQLKEVSFPWWCSNLNIDQWHLIFYQ